MTEQEWNASDDPAEMLGWVTNSSEAGRWYHEYRCPVEVSDRKLRLFACAVCLATGMATHGRADEIGHAERCSDGDWQPYRGIDGTDLSSEDAGFVARCAAGDIWGTAYMTGEWMDASSYGSVAWKDRTAVRQRLKANLLRDIVGSPHRPLWPTAAPYYAHLRRTNSTVERLVHAAYNERCPDGTLDLDLLAILADALEDAGSDDAAILAHLCSPGPHYRGMWSLDLILGKE